MRKPLAIGAATLAVALSLGLAACGSSDDSSDNGDVLTNAELVSKADAICTKYSDKLSKIQKDSGLNAQSTAADVTAFISDDIVPLYKDQIDELRTLQPNDDDADSYNAVIDTLESELKVVEDDPEGSLKSQDPFAEASKKAKDFGLESCGSN